MTADAYWDVWLASRRRRETTRRRRRRTSQVALLLGLALSWEALGHLLPPLFLPTLSSVLGALVAIVKSGELAGAIATSLPAFVAGFGLALIIGNIAGLMMGRSATADDILSPWVAIFCTVTPVAAFVPLMIIFFGLGVSARTAVVFLFSVGYVAVNTMAGVRQADPALLEVARSFSMTRRQRVGWIIVPGALPLMMAGVRIAFPRALTGVILSELILQLSVGLGFLVLSYGSVFAMAKLFAVILVILALAVLGGALISAIDRRLNRWQSVSRAEGRSGGGEV